MVTATLLSCLLGPVQDPDPATPKPARDPRTTTFALTIYQPAEKHEVNKAVHWHHPIYANGGAIRIIDHGNGSLSFRSDWNESRARVQCDGSILLYAGKVTRSEAELFSVRDEEGQIESVRAVFRGYVPDRGRIAALDRTHSTPSDPPQDVRFERLQSQSMVEGKRTRKGLQFTQTGAIGWFGPRFDSLIKVQDTRKLFVSASEALLADPARLKAFAAAAKKGEPAEFEVITMPGVARYGLYYAGPQWIVFPGINATLDRFELRLGRDKRTPYGSFWLDEKGALALFNMGGQYDLGHSSMFSSLGTPSGPQIDRASVWPVVMTFDQIYSLPPPPRKKE